MEKSQKEYYLSEQMKALKKEMGEGDDLDDEVEILEKKKQEHFYLLKFQKKAETNQEKIFSFFLLSSKNLPWEK